MPPAKLGGREGGGPAGAARPEREAEAWWGRPRPSLALVKSALGFKRVDRLPVGHLLPLAMGTQLSGAEALCLVTGGRPWHRISGHNHQW